MFKSSNIFINIYVACLCNNFVYIMLYLVSCCYCNQFLQAVLHQAITAASTYFLIVQNY